MGSSQSMIECVYMDIPRPRTCVIHSDSASASAPPSHPRPGAVVGMAIWDDGRDSGYWFHCGSCNVLWGLDPPPDPWIQCPACPNCSTITKSTSGTVGFSYRWIRLPTSRILMWATLGPMSGFPEHDDHRHRICRWATGGGHGGVAGSVAAADTATSYEVPRVAQPYKFSRFGDRARGMDSPPPGV